MYTNKLSLIFTLTSPNPFYMRHLYILFAAVVLPQGLFAQAVEIVPQWFNADDTIEVRYNAALGNAALTGQSPVYVHTGLITNLSPNPGWWQHVVGNWGVHDPNGLMTQLGNHRHSKTLHIRSFYGLPQGETLQSLAMVFRNTTGSLVGREFGGGDFFIPAYSGPFVSGITHGGSGTVQVGQSAIEVIGQASELSALSLEWDGQPLVQHPNRKFLSTTLDFTGVLPGLHTLVFNAFYAGQNHRDTVWYNVPAGLPIPVPEGREEGITILSPTSVHLQLRAPGKNAVYAVGDFNNWQIDPAYRMHPDPGGQFFWLQLDNLSPSISYRFQYDVDGIRVADPYSTLVLDPWNDNFISSSTFPNRPAYPAGQNYPVGVFKTSSIGFNWDPNVQFNRFDQRDLVIYELLVRDFDAAHTWNALIQRIDYFDSLGINAIELMPVMEFEGNESWGYNPMFMMAPDKYYGPADDLKRFIEECHKKGIAIILDITLNHQFGQSPLARMYWDAVNNRPAAYNPWMNPIDKHPFSVGYDLNHESPATQVFCKKVLKHWIEEYRVDGFRFDLSKGFTQNNTLGNVGAWNAYDQNRINRLADYGNYIWSMAPGAYLILEHFSDNSEEAALSNLGFMLWGDMHYDFGQASKGWASNLSGALAANRGWWAKNLVAYAESHDQDRVVRGNLTFGNAWAGHNVQDSATAIARAGLSMALLMAVPGPKMFWQFGELGYDYSIDYCPDGTLSSSCRLANKPIRWDYADDPARRQLFADFRDLIYLKTHEQAFRNDPTQFNMAGLVKNVSLENGSSKVMVAANTDVVGQNAFLNMPVAGKWYDVLRQDSVILGSTNYNLALAPGEFRVLTTRKMALPSHSFEADVVPDSLQLCWIEGDSLGVSGPYSVALWSTGETAERIAARQTRTYWVEVENEFGKRTRDSVYVEVDCPPSDTALLSFFSPYSLHEARIGTSVVLEGDWALVGAPGLSGRYGEAHDSTDGPELPGMGGVAVFGKGDNGDWVEWALLRADDRDGQDGFGQSVDFSEPYALIGAPEENGSGAAYTFAVNELGQWSEVEKLRPTGVQAGDGFGTAVARTGSTWAVGAPGHDRDASGQSVRSNAGAVFGSATGMAGVQKLVASDRFAGDGFGTALGLLDTTLVIGAPFEDQDTNGLFTRTDAGSAYVFAMRPAGWVQTQKITSPQRTAGARFGTSIALDGQKMAVGAPQGGGEVTCFRRGIHRWIVVTVKRDGASGSGFGKSVALRGEWLAIGAPDAPGGGEVYLYRWAQPQQPPVLLKVYSARNPEELFGGALAIDADLMLVGMPGTDQPPGANQGRAALFSLAGAEFAPAYWVGVRTDAETLWDTDSKADAFLSVVPNPVRDVFEVRSAERVQTMRLYDSAGRVVAQFSSNTAALNGVPSGIYTLRVWMESGQVEAVRLSVLH
ncbi:hypothetical protein GC167_08660 [bacterium]|nr:hypothetical protein [bacterium]